MRKGKYIPEGTVIHVHVCRDGMSYEDDDILHGESAWAIVTIGDTIKDGMWVRWFGDREVGIDCVGGSDQFDIPDPSSWPDYVAVEVAKYHLLGDNHEEG